MTRRPDAPSRLMIEMTELAGDMRANGTMDQGTFDEITLRPLVEKETIVFAPLSAEDVRGIRVESRMTRAVFAQHLNVPVDYISELERGATRPTGATLALLTVIRRRGIAALF